MWEDTLIGFFKTASLYLEDSLTIRHWLEVIRFTAENVKSRSYFEIKING